mmetsp:Transcript_27799/g.26855  ORF Transcript_27799/g.26855 Transcript_27799/m.26855 type:complete len:88 (+) Transcript_27799:1247-1510(+)
MEKIRVANIVRHDLENKLAKQVQQIEYLHSLMEEANKKYEEHKEKMAELKMELHSAKEHRDKAEKQSFILKGKYETLLRESGTNTFF